MNLIATIIAQDPVGMKQLRAARSRGLPAHLFRTDGPHLLHLVTCTNRRNLSGGGFHYADNLVVSAEEVS